jgi:CubicO group peptidase (beta-lactamase class C family)
MALELLLHVLFLLQSSVTMLFSKSFPAVFTLATTVHQAEANPRYCPPYGSVLPAPRHASQHPAVKFSIDAITSSLKEQSKGFNVSGISVGIQSIHEDKPLLNFHHTPHIINPEHGAKVINADTVYRLGSISKVYTVLAALKLAEDGVLRMSDPITRWIPELGKSAGHSARDELDVIHWEDITVGDAAAHLSGLGGDSKILFPNSHRLA